MSIANNAAKTPLLYADQMDHFIWNGSNIQHLNTPKYAAVFFDTWQKHTHTQLIRQHMQLITFDMLIAFACNKIQINCVETVKRRTIAQSNPRNV